MRSEADLDAIFSCEHVAVCPISGDWLPRDSDYGLVSGFSPTETGKLMGEPLVEDCPSHVMLSRSPQRIALSKLHCFASIYQELESGCPRPV